MYTRVEQISEYTVENETQASHCQRKKLQISKGRREARMNLVDGIWRHSYAPMFVCR